MALWIVALFGFALGALAGLLVAVGFFPCPGPYAITVPPVSRKPSSPLVTTAFEDIPKKFLDELHAHLSIRISAETAELGMAVSRESHQEMPFDQIEKLCELVKTFLVAADQTTANKSEDFAQSVTRILDSEKHGTLGTLFLSSAAAAATLSAVVILGACAALVASLRDYEAKGRVISRLEELIATGKMQEMATFKGVYESAAELIASGRIGPGPIDINRSQLRVLKAMWLQRFESGIQQAPSPNTGLFSSKFTAESLSRFEDAIEDASNHLYYSFFATYIDFCICDAINAPEIFLHGLESDVRSFTKALHCLDRKMAITPGAPTPRAIRVREGIRQRLELFEKLHLIFPFLPGSGISEVDIPPLTYGTRLTLFCKAVVSKFRAGKAG
jgi:hypothetical protein